MTFSEENKEIMEDMTDADYKACANLISKLKRNSNVSPFLKPVDPIALGIPDYFEKIKHPMDVSTIKSKLDNKAYKKISEFDDDFNLMFNNCYFYNHPESYVYSMCKELQKVYVSYFKEMEKSKTKDTRKKIKIDTVEDKGKRTLSPLTMSIDDYDFCLNVLNEIDKSKYRKFTWPFLFPVTEEDAPGYFGIIKYPMDLSTVKGKLENKQYASSAEFISDLNFIPQNCLKYNPKDTEVYKCGEELSKLISSLLNNNTKDVESRIEEIRKNISLLTQELSQLEKQSKNIIYNLADRERVGRAIKSINPTYIKGVEKIIYRACAYEFIDTDEIVINLQTMKDDVVHELDEYIKKVESGNYVETDSVSDE